MMRFPLLLAALLPLLTTGPAFAEEIVAPLPPQAALRRPFALALAPENRLWIANQRSGTLQLVDPAAEKLLAEWKIGEELADLAALPDGRLALVDTANHELLLVEPPAQAEQWEQAKLTITRVPVARYPVGLAVGPEGRYLAVASLWSQRVTILDAATGRVEHTLEMPFAVRKLLALEGPARLIAADAFAGRLAVIDPAAGEIERLREFPGHNIRGLSLSADGSMLIVAHQMLNDLANTTRNDVHWGLVMSNDLRWLRLAAITSEEGDLYRGAYMQPLGEANNGGGDPAGIAVTREGIVVASLGAANEVMLARDNRSGNIRLDVEARPTAVLISADQRFAFVAETFNDSLAVIDLEKYTVSKRFELGPRGKLTAIDRGEQLFYAGRLAHDRWMSCHSCHTDGHANGGSSDNLSDGTFGAPKRVLSLLGVKDTLPLAWNGETKTLAEQVRNSIVKTMQAPEPPTEQETADLVAYLETFEPPPSLAAARQRPESELVLRGAAHFEELGCARCHKPPSYTTPRTYDVGLEDKLGNRRFNPPSLLGVSQRGPLFHDGAVPDVETLLREGSHQLREPLAPEVQAELRAFLESL